MLREKISSDSGATLVLALVFFLLCAVAGTVILVAGSGAAGRLADVKDDQQAYYSTTSAARLMEAEIGKQKYSVDGSGHVEEGAGHVDGALEGLLRDGITTVKMNGEEYTVKDGKIINDGESVLNVDFEFTMDTEYGIIIKVMKKTKSEDKVQYQCTINAKSTTKEGTNGTEIQWEQEDIRISK